MVDDDADNAADLAFAFSERLKEHTELHYIVLKHD